MPHLPRAAAEEDEMLRLPTAIGGLQGAEADLEPVKFMIFLRCAACCEQAMNRDALRPDKKSTFGNSLYVLLWAQSLSLLIQIYHN